MRKMYIWGLLAITFLITIACGGSSTATPKKDSQPTELKQPTMTGILEPKIPTLTLKPNTSTVAPTSRSAPLATNTQSSQVCNCNKDYDCKDFQTQREAQKCFEYCGGSKTNNWSKLDGSDKDGKVCESLP